MRPKLTAFIFSSPYLWINNNKTMKYIKKFETHADYEAYINGGAVLPNVSYCVDLNEVHFNKYIKPEPVFALKFIPTSPNEDEIVIGCDDISDGLLTYDVVSDNGITEESEGSIIIGNCVTKIDDEVFWDYNGITSVFFPNSVTEIFSGTFHGCTSLTSIIIPNSVTSIGNGAFTDCSGLISITCEPQLPPVADILMFENTNNCPIYVPSESVNAYKAATNWSTYASRIQAIPTA